MRRPAPEPVSRAPSARWGAGSILAGGDGAVWVRAARARRRRRGWHAGCWCGDGRGGRRRAKEYMIRAPPSSGPGWRAWRFGIVEKIY